MPLCISKLKLRDVANAAFTSSGASRSHTTQAFPVHFSFGQESYIRQEAGDGENSGLSLDPHRHSRPDKKVLNLKKSGLNDLNHVKMLRLITPSHVYESIFKCSKSDLNILSLV